MGIRAKAIISILILIFTFSLVSFSKFSSDDDKGSANCSDLIGNWEAIGPTSINIRFTNDSMYYSINTKTGLIGCVRNKYSCQIFGDSIFVTTNEEKPVHFLVIKLSEQLSILGGYKNVKGLEHNLTPLVLLMRKETNLPDKYQKFTNAELIKEYSRQPDIFLLPKVFSGILAVTYDQADGIKPIQDLKGRRIYSISDTKSFLVRLTGHPNLFNFVTNNIRFYYKASKDSLIRMPVYKYYDSIPDDSIVNNYHVFIMGYDRIERNKINNIIKGNITSNILFLKITRELYYNINHLGRDSVFHMGKYYQLSIWK